jgi:hypothetical protein
MAGNNSQDSLPPASDLNPGLPSTNDACPQCNRAFLYLTVHTRVGSCPEGGTQTEGVWEQGSGEGESGRRMEKTT